MEFQKLCTCQAQGRHRVGSKVQLPLSADGKKEGAGGAPCALGHQAGSHSLEVEQKIQALRGILLVDSEALPTLIVLGDATISQRCSQLM